MLQKDPPRLPPFHFHVDPDPAFHFDADSNPTFHFNADPDPAFRFDADSDPDLASHNSGSGSATLVPNFKRLNPVLYISYPDSIEGLTSVPVP